MSFVVSLQALGGALVLVGGISSVIGQGDWGLDVQAIALSSLFSLMKGILTIASHSCFFPFMSDSKSFG